MTILFVLAFLLTAFISTIKLNLSAINCLISFHRNRHRLLHWYTDLVTTSPSNTVTLSRLFARRTIITANPSNVQHILSTNFPNYPKGQPFAEILGDLLGNGIFNSDGQIWLSQRKLAAHAFTRRSLRRLVDHVLRPEIFHRFLPSLAADGETVYDLQTLLRGLTYRVICHAFLGPAEPHPRLADALDAASAISAARGAAPIALVWKVKRALRLGSERRLREAVDLVRASVTDIIRNRRIGQSDISSNSLCASEKILHKPDIVVVDDDEEEEEMMRDMVISFLMAGKDTTASALTWFFWLVSTHPEIESKIVSEISRTGENTMMSYERLKEMKYLESSLMESMRLYPPVAWDSKHAAEDDVFPDGTVVKKGDRVTYFPYGMGRMEKIWGEDWGEFRPERWAAGATAFEFPVFQAGPRVCLGKEMAMVQMKFVAAAVMGRLRLRWLGTEAPVMVPLLTAHMDGGLPVVVVERIVPLVPKDDA